MKKTSWAMVLITALISVVGLLKLFTASSDDLKDNVNTNNLNGAFTPKQAPILTNITKADKTQLVDDYDPYKDELFKSQLLEVAGLYAETIKYPITSQPIRNPEDVRELKPFEEAEVDLPFPENDDDSDPIRVSAATDAYQYFDGDVIKLRVHINRVEEDQFAKVTAVIAGSQGDLPFKLDFNETDDSRTVFVASFDTRIAPKNLMSREMLAKLNVTLGSRQLFTTVGFRYAVASAQVVGVRPTYVEGPNLVIPLQLNVYQSGYYFIGGVLEDQQTSQPLIQLQSEARLGQGNAVLALNAHIAALRQQGSEGPYVLRSIKIHRSSEVGEIYDSPASSAQTRFNVQGFPFSEFDDQAYVDEHGQESADYLEDTASLGNDEEAL